MPLNSPIKPSKVSRSYTVVLSTDDANRSNLAMGEYFIQRPHDYFMTTAENFADFERDVSQRLQSCEVIKKICYKGDMSFPITIANESDFELFRDQWLFIKMVTVVKGRSEKPLQPEPVAVANAMIAESTILAAAASFQSTTASLEKVASSLASVAESLASMTNLMAIKADAKSTTSMSDDADSDDAESDDAESDNAESDDAESDASSSVGTSTDTASEICSQDSSLESIDESLNHEELKSSVRNYVYLQSMIKDMDNLEPDTNFFEFPAKGILRPATPTSGITSFGGYNYDIDDRIEEALSTVMAMGFTHEPDLVRRFLQQTRGNIEDALDIMKLL